ncbi:MAG: HupE/UreJ family protein [Pseudomonadota bacterium]
MLLVFVCASFASAHNVSPEDARRIAGKTGWHFGLYAWLGAKHMYTGYDHLLFLVGVIFYLKSLRSIVLYVSLFSIGHSLTLILGVLAELNVNPYLVDAIIGFSVIYKGFDNVNGFQTAFQSDPPDERVAIGIFGLFHGLGLATKLQELGLHPDGLVANLLSFNLGVELGQILALTVIVLVLRLFPAQAKQGLAGQTVNVGLMLGGASLMFYQLLLYLEF